jgi:hypothetical protein
MELLNQFSPAPLHITSSRLGPDILLSSLFSDALNLCPSLDVSDSVSHPYNTTGEVETEVLTAVRMTLLFWVLKPFRFVGTYQHFGETYCLHL